MITLHIGKLLADNGFGTLVLTGSETGNDLIFFEKMPIGKNGVFIMSTGNPMGRGVRVTQAFNIYSRGTNDLVGGTKLEAILEFFRGSGDGRLTNCDLPIVAGYSNTKYKNVLIEPTGNIQNVGQDANDRVIYTVSANVTYNKEKQS